MKKESLPRAFARSRRAGRQLAPGVWFLLGLLAAARLALGQTSPGNDLTENEILMHSVVNVPLAQIGRFADAVDPVSIKWARAAMHRPQLAWELRQTLNTSERHAAEAAAALSMLDPEEARRRHEAAEAARSPQSPAEQNAAAQAANDRRDALRAILDPLTVSREKEMTKDAATRRREAVAEFAILQPRAFNERVDRHKSPELRQKETDAIHAFIDPAGFLRQRERLNKGSSKERPNEIGPTSEPAPSLNPQPRSEKGTQGGGR